MTPRALRLAIIAALVAVAAGYFFLTRHASQDPVTSVPAAPAVPATPTPPVAPPADEPAAQPSAQPSAPAPASSPTAASPKPASSKPASPGRISGNYAEDWMKICGPIQGEAQKGCTAKLDAAYGRADDKPVPPSAK